MPLLSACIKWDTLCSFVRISNDVGVWQWVNLMGGGNLTFLLLRKRNELLGVSSAAGTATAEAASSSSSSLHYEPF